MAYGRPYRAALLTLAVLTTTSSLILLAIPWLAGQMLGGVVSGGMGAQGWNIVLLVALMVMTTLINFAVASHSTVTAGRLLAELRQRVYEHVQRVPIGFHDVRGKGDTLALLTYEITRLSHFFTGTLVSIPSKVLMTLGAIVLMFRIDSRLGLIVPIFVPAFYLILKLIGRRLRSVAAELQRAEARVVELAEEMLEMLPAIKAFTREQADANRYRASVGESSRLTMREGRIYAVVDPIIGLIGSLGVMLILLLGGLSVQTGQLSPPEMFSFVLYIALLTRPVSSLAHVYGEVQTARGTLVRLQSVLAQPIEPFAIAQDSCGRARGELQLDDVHFAYPDRKPTLSGANLHIAPGEWVALLGSNGAGKTAIINLLMRYYEPQRGSVRLDGRDLAGIGVADLRRQIGLVPQIPLLFNGTIRDNIAFGAELVTELRIEQAARLAQAFDFIMALPQGMDTVIGDRGVRLSGGQRQRIALARALVKDPPILVFDEATSMFDTEGECAFIAACSDALRGRTVILITHRPAALALADRAFILEGGVLRETRPQQAVLARASA